MRDETTQAREDQANEDRRRNDGRYYRDPIDAARMGGTVPPGYDKLTGELLTPASSVPPCLHRYAVIDGTCTGCGEFLPEKVC